MMPGRLTGKHILVVEDEYFIASDIKRALQSEDATVVGPVGQLERGLALADHAVVDAAILDVNLGTAMVYPIADQLRHAETPCLFVTGYDWAMPAAYRDIPHMAKPFAMSAVLDKVVELVAGGTTS